LLPLLDLDSGYRRDWILFDFLAGLALWAVMVPGAMAYAGTIEGAWYRAANDERRSAGNRGLERRQRGRVRQRRMRGSVCAVFAKAQVEHRPYGKHQRPTPEDRKSRLKQSQEACCAAYVARARRVQEQQKPQNRPIQGHGAPVARGSGARDSSSLAMFPRSAASSIRMI